MNLAEKINVMRASVMGANDGILSVAGIVIGVAGATSNSHAILLSGLSGMLAGTVSMAMGEYVSVNAQRDGEKNAVIKESRALDNDFDQEVAFIQQQYIDTGISADLAAQAASEMMADDPLSTAVRERYGFDRHEKTSAIAAAMASMISFPIGSILPLVAIGFFPAAIRVWATVCAVIIALTITGYTAAALGNANRWRAALRNIVSGLLTMAVTYFVGTLFAH
mgnify:CR=1 FL=1